MTSLTNLGSHQLLVTSDPRIQKSDDNDFVRYFNPLANIFNKIAGKKPLESLGISSISGFSNHDILIRLADKINKVVSQIEIFKNIAKKRGFELLRASDSVSPLLSEQVSIDEFDGRIVNLPQYADFSKLNPLDKCCTALDDFIENILKPQQDSLGQDKMTKAELVSFVGKFNNTTYLEGLAKIAIELAADKVCILEKEFYRVNTDDIVKELSSLGAGFNALINNFKKDLEKLIRKKEVLVEGMLTKGCLDKILSGDLQGRILITQAEGHERIVTLSSSTILIIQNFKEYIFEPFIDIIEASNTDESNFRDEFHKDFPIEGLESVNELLELMRYFEAISEIEEVKKLGSSDKINNKHIANYHVQEHSAKK